MHVVGCMSPIMNIDNHVQPSVTCGHEHVGLPGDNSALHSVTPIIEKLLCLTQIFTSDVTLILSKSLGIRCHLERMEIMIIYELVKLQSVQNTMLFSFKKSNVS